MSKSDFIKLDKKLDSSVAGVEARLRKSYEGKLKILRKYLSDLYSSYGDGKRIPAGEIAKFNRAKAINRELIYVANGMYRGLFEDIEKDLKAIYIASYDTTKGVLEAQSGKIVRGDVKIDALEKAIKSPIAGLTIDMRLDGYKEELGRKLTRAIIGGAQQGKTLKQVSYDLRNEFNGNSSHVVRIFETEAHRLMEQAKLDEAERAEKQGVKTFKRWVSMRDSSVRDAHRILDGQTRKLDELFESPTGAKGLSPGNMGSASDDINCRCFMEIFTEGE